jgi:hypothetical protein
VLLSLWKSVMNLLKLRLFNKSSYMRGSVQKEYLRFVATLSTCFCWIEGARGEAIVVAVSLCSPFEQIVKKLNFAV